ncbi:uncharacterized protein VTP21DRAFT_4674 [Calcarisporiella thermophila]|uniref:uncharacterized protein n=1 Tax=Calcarisporiella thermophila TaxID=911321 RepID=UPI003743CB8E
MDLSSLLKSEIDRKRKKIEAVNGNGPKKKYYSRAELEKIREKEYLEEQERLERERMEKLRKRLKLDEKEAKDQGSEHSDVEDKEKEDQEKEETDTLNLKPEEITRRLRARGQPIRLFGETDKERKLRLRALELIEERTEGQRNDFMRTLESLESGMELEVLKKQADSGEDTGSGNDEKSKEDLKELPIDLGLLRTEPDKLYGLIYVYLKRRLKDWEQYMKDRPDHVKHSTQGKLQAAMQKQSEQYMKPLFRRLKTKDLEPDVLARIAEITHYMQNREYMNAQDSYLRLSIGNAPWPIGVTMVGIHERSAREKIFSTQVAHVLNDETSRKWIQCIKRLMTFCQQKYPPDTHAQLVG